MTRRFVAWLVGSTMLGGCFLLEDGGIEALPVGAFVEASGTAGTLPPVVDEIDEVPAGESDKPEKAQLVGRVEAADQAAVTMFGRRFAVDERTGFADRNGRVSAPFVAAIGEWVELKVRDQDDGGQRVRDLQRLVERERFKVTGFVREVDPFARIIDVGGVRLPVAPDVDLELDRETVADDPLALFLNDDQKSVPFGIALGESGRFGGQVAAEYETNEEFDLDPSRDRDRTKPQVGGRFDLLWQIDDRGSYALGELSMGRRDTLRENDLDTYAEQFELTRGFAAVQVADSLQLLIGRQDFDEGREWLYDEVLDGVRLVHRSPYLKVELAVATGRQLFAEGNGNQHTGLVLAKAMFGLDGDWQYGAYAMRRSDDTSVGFEPLYFGLQSTAEPRYGFGHWAELAIARGEAGRRELHGFAYDLGLRYAFDLPWRPFLAVGQAFGNGYGADDERSGYRQSGLQDNTAKLGGVTSIRFYGELLDPELSNLAITTLCAAVRPLNNLSLSLLWHGYRQDVASTVLVNTSLRAVPTGRSTDIGSEVDFVIGYRVARRLTVELTTGRFWAGDAFAVDSSATLINLTTRLSF